MMKLLKRKIIIRTINNPVIGPNNLDQYGIKKSLQDPQKFDEPELDKVIIY